ncbi:MAG TPA: 23S rRNA (adenine(2503)-C(2))-methyltransferase RlmN [Terriglobia bacterium]|nr:23S rRNA (adenine(2503)-C(2))-methyltransferase RlmN [Terriglobia bacterium]
MEKRSIQAGNIFGLDRKELEAIAVAQAHPGYRGRQLFRALYSRRVRNFDSITELGKDFRESLAGRYRIDYPSVERTYESSDGAVRYLLGLEDGRRVETVYMPDKNRTTVCVSSQAGCAVDCQFCFTALRGLERNLSPGEILGQLYILLEAGRELPKARLNVVFMGMGEPLLNFRSVMKAVQVLGDPEGLGIPLRRITISTAGIVPGIVKLGREPVRPKLAVSLNASRDQERTALMPLNRKYPLGELLAACRSYPLRPWERLTFEYVLLDGINDSDSDARRVVELVRGIRCKINLIPYNPGPGLPYRPSPLARVLAFQQILTRRHIPAFIRISRGQDVSAACGQLRLADATGSSLLDQVPDLHSPMA